MSPAFFFSKVNLAVSILSTVTKHPLKKHRTEYSTVTVARTAYNTRLVSGQQTIKEWRAAVDQVITFSGFVTTL
jgi:hypothetical protein